MNAITIILKGNELVITGALTQDTVMLALEQSMALMPNDSLIQVDLKGVSRCDSASLSFLTALLREGKRRRTQLQLNHMPKQMRQISSVSGLDELLPIGES